MTRTVLVVSHNRAFRAGLKPLRGRQVRVLQAPNGLGALFLCASEAVDLLVIDPSTPGMDCRKLLEKISSAFPEMAVLTDPDAEKIRDALDTPRRKGPGQVRAAAISCAS
ncbi:MAG: hypothetical protein ACM336_04390 [Acidobacteriota bacterium]